VAGVASAGRVVDFRRQAVTKLLINEPPLQVLPTLAEIVGLNEAIVIQQLHYLSNFPNFGVVINGNRWIYFTYEQWREEYFPFWSVRTIQRTFQNLEENNYVIVAQLDKKSHDMRKYYRLNYYQIGTIEIKLTQSTITSNCCNGYTENTETTTETTDSRESLIPVVEESFEFLQEIQEEEKPKKTERDTTQKPDLGFHTSAELILSEMLVAHYTALGRRVPKAWANPMQRDLFNRYASGMTESTLKSYLETQFARKPALADISVNIKNWVSSGNKKKSGHKEETLREKWEREGRI